MRTLEIFEFLKSLVDLFPVKVNIDLKGGWENVQRNFGRKTQWSLCTSLKGQCHNIFYFYFFHETSSPKPLKITLRSFEIFLKIVETFASQGGPPVSMFQWHWRQILPLKSLILLLQVAMSMIPAANLLLVSMTPVANCTGINNTSGKFATGVNNTSGK